MTISLIVSGKDISELVETVTWSGGDWHGNLSSCTTKKAENKNVPCLLECSLFLLKQGFIETEPELRHAGCTGNLDWLWRNESKFLKVAFPNNQKLVVYIYLA